jgi:hypothetical protein
MKVFLNIENLEDVILLCRYFFSTVNLDKDITLELFSFKIILRFPW